MGFKWIGDHGSQTVPPFTLENSTAKGSADEHQKH